MSKSDMLNELICYYTYGCNKSEFARILGVKPQTISSWLARGTFDAELIYSKCVNINPHWLLTGEGNMTIVNDQPVVISTLHTPKSPEPQIDTQTVNLYEFEASAGLRTLFDNSKANILDTIRIPNLPKCDGAIHIVGDSMYPILKSGDIILYKETPLNIDEIYFGETYLLSYYVDESDVAVVVKYVQKGDHEGKIKLVSHNQHHPPREIDFSRVNAMAIVKASIRINSMY